MLISTDASIFEIEPIAVVQPKSRENLIEIIRDLLLKNQHFTMRAGGTSIGGQAIGSGILVDISKNLTEIIDFSEELIGAKFTIDNPNAKTSCGCGTSFSI